MLKEDVGKSMTKSQTLSRGPLSEPFYGSLCVPKASFHIILPRYNPHVSNNSWCGDEYKESRNCNME